MALPGAGAQALAAVVGVARAPVGRPDSEQRWALAAALAATLLRRLVRAAGVASRLRGVTAGRGPGPGEVTVTWPSSGDPGVDDAVGAALHRLQGWLAADPDEGGLRGALREEGERVAAARGRPGG